MTTIPDRVCQLPGCRKAIGKSRSANARYCSKQHQSKAAELRRRQRNKVASIEAAGTMVGDDTQRRGKIYQELEGGYGKLIEDGELSMSQVAEILGYTTAGVSRAMGAWRTTQAINLRNENWTRDPDIDALVPTAMFEWVADHFTMDDYEAGNPLCHVLINMLEEAFWRFEHRYFTIGSRGATMVVKPFHREIVHELVLSAVFAGRVLILTPPRHGKSEVMLRFCGWLLIMFPNYQILWVASNTDLAGQMCTKLRGVFHHNQLLNDEMLPPGQVFLDERAPKYSESAFTLYTRTDKTLKSPSFTALGSTATVAGRDVDYGVVDDLEERKTVATSDLRHKSRVKHSEIMERKEDHTGFATIGSRQHLDDIPNHLMGEEGEEAWRILEYSAHLDECDLDPDDYTLHTDCMLLPEVRPYRWLMQQKAETDALGLPGRFELRYLQKAVALEGVIFDLKVIRNECLDRSRGVGIPPGIHGRMIAGLDPAARGVQASFGWLWTPEQLYMIDLEEVQAGGVIGAMDVMKDWYARYQLTDWIHEDNSGQIDAWKHVEVYQRFLERSPVQFKPHTTGGNKHDPESGIAAMAPWFHSGKINLPYGTDEARRKVNAYLRQLELWTSDGLKGRGKTDIKMAAWLPFPRIQKWSWDQEEIEVELDGSQSYPGLDGYNSVPWTSTMYPGSR